MGYTKPIETAQAIYVVSLENHAVPDHSAYSRYRPDGVAIEGTMGVLSVLPDLRRHVENPELSSRRDFRWIADLLRRKIEIVSVDPFPVSSELVKLYGRGIGSAMLIGLSAYRTVVLAQKKFKKKKIPRRELLIALGLAAAGEALAPSITDAPLFFPGEIKGRRPLLGISSFLNRHLLPVVSEARNAISAEKLETIVAPRMKRELGRKPLILIQMGAGHSGIVDMLRDVEERRKTLHELGPLIRKGIRPAELDRVISVKWDAKKRMLETRDERSTVSDWLGKAPVRERRYVASVHEPVEPTRFSRRSMVRGLLPVRGRKTTRTH